MGSVVFTEQLDGIDKLDRFDSVVVISKDGSTMAVGAEKGNCVGVFRRNGISLKNSCRRPVWKMRRVEPGWVDFGSWGME
jgi:hypothetical protein